MAGRRKKGSKDWKLVVRIHAAAESGLQRQVLARAEKRGIKCDGE